MGGMTPSGIPDATSTGRGLMTEEQVEKLDALDPEGGYVTSVSAPFQVTAGNLSAPNASTSATGFMTASHVNQLDTASSTAASALSAAGAAQATADAAVPVAGTTTITGAKTFAALVTAALGMITSLIRAVGVALVLRSDIGAGGSDVAVKIGTSENDVATNNGATLAWFGTGVGGSEVNSMSVRKGGLLVGGSASLTLNNTVGARISYGSSYVTAGATIDGGGSSVRFLAQTAIDSGAYGIRVGLDGPDSAANSNGKILNVGTTTADKFNVYKDRTVSYGAHYFDRSLVDLGTSGFPLQIIHTGNQGLQVDTTLGVAASSTLFAFRTVGDPKAIVRGNGEFEVLTGGAGIVLKSPDGTKRARLSIDNAGALVVTVI